MDCRGTRFNDWSDDTHERILPSSKQELHPEVASSIPFRYVRRREPNSPRYRARLLQVRQRFSCMGSRTQSQRVSCHIFAPRPYPRFTLARQSILAWHMPEHGIHRWVPKSHWRGNPCRPARVLLEICGKDDSRIRGDIQGQPMTHTSHWFSSPVY